MAMGVFTNNRAMYGRALRYYVNGAGDGRLTYYIYSSGQCQEIGRDQVHTQLGLAHLGDASEVAWHQGLDLYLYVGNRLLVGFEYAAKYNLGEEGSVRAGLGPDRQICPYRDFAARAAPCGLRADLQSLCEPCGSRSSVHSESAEKVRPEGAAQDADHTGFGTLLYTRLKSPDTAAVVSAPPVAVIAAPVAATIRLTWIQTRGAASCTVKRATSKGGPYAPSATNLRSAEYIDAKVKAGTLCYYVMTEVGADSLETSMTAGLPASWQHSDIGTALF